VKKLTKKVYLFTWMVPAYLMSKGLGAPAGSILLGSAGFIKEARIWRKRLGGGMRQIGILAAAGLIALEEGPKLLEADHANARRLAQGLSEIPGIALDADGVVTNIVIFDVAATGQSPAEICGKLNAKGILAIGFDTSIRMVTHRDVSSDDVTATVTAMRSCV
jgi:threonine aldolase